HIPPSAGMQMFRLSNRVPAVPVATCAPLRNSFAHVPDTVPTTKPTKPVTLFALIDPPPSQMNSNKIMRLFLRRYERFVANADDPPMPNNSTPSAAPAK